ncbi:hypothetical protein BJX68DRAFT_272917 [Aspergillus pseudodeflectus]|uniref:Norsolorinic acid reductase n=1 Tax=Aspergillus pseudodeflectus TaxID=176178 RepID=A0ABR4JCP6_9EURO
MCYDKARSLSLIALELGEVEETARICAEIHPGIRTEVAVFDITDPTATKGFLAEDEAQFGGIDVLVANAGRPPQWLPVSEGDPQIWWDTVEVSLRGAYNFARFALPTMQKRRGG